MARKIRSLFSGIGVPGRRLALLAVAAALVLTGAGPGSVTPPNGPDGATPGPAVSAAGHAVVVELFTSQGCSSCPPADRLLTKLGEAGGPPIIPLAFHVDIWNHIGWSDPFSARTWTERQVGYAKRFGLDQLSTPQAVVDGGTQLVGSDERGLRAAIAAAASKPAVDIALRVEPASGASKIRVDADVDVPATLKGRTLDLMLALFETGLVTPVGRGENEGQTLHNDYVVRRLVRAARLSGDKPGKTRNGETFSVDKGWDRSHLGVAAFLQDPATLEIRGASARPLAAAAVASR